HVVALSAQRAGQRLGDSHVVLCEQYAGHGAIVGCFGRLAGYSLVTRLRFDPANSVSSGFAAFPTGSRLLPDQGFSLLLSALGQASESTHAECRPAKCPAPLPSNSVGVPSSTIRPPSMTSTRSAISTVESRCAMISA